MKGWKRHQTDWAVNSGNIQWRKEHITKVVIPGYSWLSSETRMNEPGWTGYLWWVSHTLYSCPRQAAVGVMSLQWTDSLLAGSFCNSVGSQWGIWETIPFIVGSLIFTSPTRVLALAQLTARSASCNWPSVAATPKKNVTCFTTAKTVEQQSLTHLSTNGERSLNSTVPW